MKKLKLLLSMVLGMGFSSIFAQDHCVTDHLNEQLYDHILETQGVDVRTDRTADIKANRNNNSHERAIRTIPVIFHVVLNSTRQAQVSDADIQNYINGVNQEFLANINTSNVRAQFQGDITNVEIQFCLAQQDEAGNALATPGIERRTVTSDYFNPSSTTDNSPADGYADEPNAMKSFANGGLDPWNRNDYLNVWITNITNGASFGTAGYAYKPFSTATIGISSAYDGIVIDYNLGMFNSSTLTHEIGHYLGLDHTWGGGNGSCSTDDGFTDTPNTSGDAYSALGGNGCNNGSPCGVTVQYENFMDYSNCQYMYTPQQSTYMNNVLSGARSSLLSSIGCNSPDAPPIADFSGTPTTIIEGQSVNFTDLSTGTPTGWSWSFPGAATTTSTAQNPTGITYNTAGLYSVTLTASNGFGAGTPVTKTDYIEVLPPSAGGTCDVVNIDKVGADWTPAFYTAGGTDGYVAGTNAYGDAGKYEYFPAVSTGGQPYMTGVYMVFGEALSVGGTSTIEVRVYDGTGQARGALLASVPVTLGDLQTSVYEYIAMPNAVELPASGEIFVGIDFSGLPTSDTVALFTNTVGDAAGNTVGYEEWSDGTFDTYNTGWGADFNNLIFPTLTGDTAVATISSAAEVCAGASLDFDASGSTYQDTLIWSFVGGNPVQVSNNVMTSTSYATAGSYMAYLQVVGGACGDYAIDSIQVLVNAAPTAGAVATDASCGNTDGIITVSGTGGLAPYDYNFENGVFGATNVFSGNGAGTYTVGVQDANGCTNTTTATIGETGGPVINSITPVAPECAGGTDGSITVNATGAGLTYSFDNGATYGASNTTTAGAGNYTVIVNDGSCTTTQSVSVNDGLTINASITGNTTLCDGQSTTLTASGATNYVWNTAANTNAITVTPAIGSTTYSVTASTGNCSDIASTTVMVYAYPTANATADNYVVVLSGGNATVNFTGTGNGTYAWNFGDGNTSTQQNPSHTYTNAGTYTVTLTVNNNGCTDVSTITILVEQSTGFADNELNFVNVAPNPTQGTIKINLGKSGQNADIQIIDVVGKVVAEFGSVNDTEMSYTFNNNNAGVYFIKVAIGTQSKTFKITKL